MSRGQARSDGSQANGRRTILGISIVHYTRLFEHTHSDAQTVAESSKPACTADACCSQMELYMNRALRRLLAWLLEELLLVFRPHDFRAAIKDSEDRVLDQRVDT